MMFDTYYGILLIVFIWGHVFQRSWGLDFRLSLQFFIPVFFTHIEQVRDVDAQCELVGTER